MRIELASHPLIDQRLFQELIKTTMNINSSMKNLHASVSTDILNSYKPHMNEFEITNYK